MDVRFAVLADYANTTREGKLNIMGVFGEINPPVLPFVLPTMFLVVSYAASAAEVGREHALEVLLMDSEGRSILGLKSTLTVPPATGPSGRSEMSAVLRLDGVRFEKADVYQFSILVGGQEKDVVPLRVNQPAADTPKESE